MSLAKLVGQSDKAHGVRESEKALSVQTTFNIFCISQQTLYLSKKELYLYYNEKVNIFYKNFESIK